MVSSCDIVTELDQLEGEMLVCIKFRLLLFLFLFISYNSFAQDYLEVVPQRGEGIFSLLKRYSLPSDSSYFNKFVELNKKNLTTKNDLIQDRKYKLPIMLLLFDGTTIRSSLGIDDYNQAKLIQDYNNLMLDRKLRAKSFKQDNILWVPIHLIEEQQPNKNKSEIYQEIKQNVVTDTSKKTESIEKLKKINENKAIKGLNPLFFGTKYKTIDKVSNRLLGFVYYLDPGHGGIDPGAIGYREGNELTEDEYAYDVTLRLARRLMQHGATVFMAVIDSTDGIRDDKYLKNNLNEYFGDGKPITGDAKERLQGRIDYINTIKRKIPEDYRQRLIVIHVDSRDTSQRIDVFFYHNPGDEKGKKYAENVMEMLTIKYDKAQPGRGYTGNVSERNLFMLRNSPVLSIYIELGNIQNYKDQQRFINPTNRQAIANWLCDGILHNDSPKVNITIPKKKQIKKKAK